MPKTLVGKTATFLLLVFIAEILFIAFHLLTENGFAAIIYFMLLAPIPAVFGLVFGVLGTVKEIEMNKVTSIITLLISTVCIVIFITLLVTFEFGG